MNSYFWIIAMAPDIPVSIKCFLFVVSFLITRYFWKRNLQLKFGLPTIAVIIFQLLFITLIIHVLLVISLRFGFDSDLIPIKEIAYGHYYISGILAVALGIIVGIAVRASCKNNTMKDVD